MGRSSGYCFKIIACGGSSESVDRDDLDASSEVFHYINCDIFIFIFLSCVPGILCVFD